ncbi:MAG: ribonuclease III [Chloroflexi bacterium]|nr:ribonuclease III [Chloroflexota bacterium]MYD48692.1 ribonuclease III [Chloroflexota bacterium]
MKVSEANTPGRTPSGSTGGNRPAAELEQALGLAFRDRGLLRKALTHRSCVNETGGTDIDSYERLEFLGDVVVRLIVSEELYHRLPKCDEGGLTRRWTALLSQRALAVVARRLDIAPYLRLGRGFESTGGRDSEAVLGDVMESLIAAVYLDAGPDAARRFVTAALGPEINDACQPDWRPDNPKAELQELLQAQGKPTPTYRVVSATGPAHQPQFTVEALVNGDSLGSGHGQSKSAAETEAARVALMSIRQLAPRQSR